MINSEELLKIEQATDKKRAIYLSMKERLEDIVSLMNMMGYEEQLTLRSDIPKEKPEEDLPSPLPVEDKSVLKKSDEEKTFDVSGIYVCVCSDGSAGLYKCEEKSYNDRLLNRMGMEEIRHLYVGIDSENVGAVFDTVRVRDYYTGAEIKNEHIISRVFSPGEFIFDFGVTATVKLTSVMSYSDVRMFMKSRDLMPGSAFGNASLDEINKVLAFIQGLSEEEAKEWNQIKC